MSAHLFLLPCLKFKLLVPLWFLLFSTISLHVRASAKGVRWRGQPVDSRTLAAPTEVLYAHTHIVSSECGEMHSEGWGGLIDWLSWGALVVVNGARDPVWSTALPSGSSHQETVWSTLNPTLWIVQLFSLFINLFLMFFFSSNPRYDDLKTKYVCACVCVCVYIYMKICMQPSSWLQLKMKRRSIKR